MTLYLSIVLGKKSAKTATKKSVQYCESKSPFSLITDYYELEIELSSYSSSTSRGFVVGYVAYDDGKLLL